MKKSTAALRRACEQLPEQHHREVDILLSQLTVYLEDLSHHKDHAPSALKHVLMSLQSLFDGVIREQKTPLANQPEDLVAAMRERVAASMEDASVSRRLFVDLNPDTEVISLYFANGKKNRMRFYSVVAAVKTLIHALNAKQNNDKWSVRFGRFAGVGGEDRVREARRLLSQFDDQR